MMTHTSGRKSIGALHDARTARVQRLTQTAGAIALCLLAGHARAKVAVSSPDPLQQPDLAPVEVKAAPSHAPVELVRKGQARAVVYVAPPAVTNQRGQAFETLLGELVEVIELSTSARLPMVEEMPGPEQPAIVIGDCAAARAAGIAADALPYEGFVVKTEPNRVFLVGSTKELPYTKERAELKTDGHAPDGWPRFYGNEGDAWAVADFLERFVGVRWYWPTETLGRSIVKTESLAVPPAHYRDAPVFRYREHWPWPEDPRNVRGHGSRWFDRQSPELPLPEGVERLGSHLYLLRHGTSWPYRIQVHSMPHNREERLLGSEELKNFMLDTAEEYWEGGEKPWFVTPDSLHVSFRDRLPGPQDFVPELGEMVRGGSRTAATVPMAIFLADLCQAVKDRWPDKKVVYLAYQNYTLAPKLAGGRGTQIQFPDNLELMMMNTEGMGGMKDPKRRSWNMRNIRAWSEMLGGRKFTIYDYSCFPMGWTHAPIQFPHMAQDFLLKNREYIEGSFIDGLFFPNWARTVPSMYVWMKALWNPAIDVDALLDAWCARMFGAAADTVGRLLQLMVKRWEEPLSGLYHDGRLRAAYFSATWPPEVVAEMRRLRRQALAEMAGDETASKRFEYWMFSFDAFLEEAEVAWEQAGVIPEKKITAFAFDELDPPAAGEVREFTEGWFEDAPKWPYKNEILVDVPAGTDVTALRPTIEFLGAEVAPAPGKPQDFTRPVTYTVTCAKGYVKQYAVRVY